MQMCSEKITEVSYAFPIQSGPLENSFTIPPKMLVRFVLEPELTSNQQNHNKYHKADSLNSNKAKQNR